MRANAGMSILKKLMVINNLIARPVWKIVYSARIKFLAMFALIGFIIWNKRGAFPSVPSAIAQTQRRPNATSLIILVIALIPIVLPILTIPINAMVIFIRMFV